MPIETFNGDARCELRLFHPAEKRIFFQSTSLLLLPLDSENPAPVHAREKKCEHKKSSTMPQKENLRLLHKILTSICNP
jgi:hypothetical protein